MPVEHPSARFAMTAALAVALAFSAPASAIAMNPTSGSVRMFVLEHYWKKHPVTLVEIERIDSKTRTLHFRVLADYCMQHPEQVLALDVNRIYSQQFALADSGPLESRLDYYKPRRRFLMLKGLPGASLLDFVPIPGESEAIIDAMAAISALRSAGSDRVFQAITNEMDMVAEYAINAVLDVPLPRERLQSASRNAKTVRDAEDRAIELRIAANRLFARDSATPNETEMVWLKQMAKEGATEDYRVILPIFFRMWDVPDQYPELVRTAVDLLDGATPKARSSIIGVLLSSNIVWAYCVHMGVVETVLEQSLRQLDSEDWRKRASAARQAMRIASRSRGLKRTLARKAHSRIKAALSREPNEIAQDDLKIILRELEEMTREPMAQE